MRLGCAVRSSCKTATPSKRLHLRRAHWRHAVIALLGCAMHIAASAAASDDVRDYARAPAFGLPALSPTGALLSYVEQSDERQSVLVRRLEDGTARTILSVESRRERVRWCDWPTEDTLLCGTLVPVRAPDRIIETTRLYAIDLATGRVRELNRHLHDANRDHVVDLVAADRPGQILLQHDTTGRGYPQVSSLDIRTGELSTVVRAHPPVRRWMSDARGVVRLGFAYADGDGSLFILGDEPESWKLLLKQSLDDIGAVGPLAFGATQTELFALKHRHGRSALFRWDLERPDQLALLLADDVFDVSGPVILHPQSRALLAVQYAADAERRHYFDPAEAATAAWLDEQLPDAVNLVIDRSQDNRRQLVLSGGDVEAPSLYLFDAERKSLALIGHNYPELEDRPLARMQSITYAARDGQRIPAFLTLPQKASAKVPAIVLPHGGPEARTVKGFDPLVQFLAAQGYAVLQMNFRGSLGYGARFAAAGVGQWGGVIHNDITDGARWLIEQNIADPVRVCIVGSSFGGYAALLGATRESQWYACAASFGGVSDLLAMSQYTERLRDADVWRRRFGGSSRALWQMSPMARVQATETPVLLMHGRHDAVVPISQSKRFARVLRKAGKSHRIFERADCDHEMTLQSCRLAFFTELKEFVSDAID